MKKHVPDNKPALTEKGFVKPPQDLFVFDKGYEADVDDNYDTVIAFRYSDEKEFAQKIGRDLGRTDSHVPTASSQSGSAQQPPQFAVFLLCLFLSRTDRD